MKTFTKHILLLALMLFGVAGAAWALPSRAPQKFTGPVAFNSLVQGDTLAPGFSITDLHFNNNLVFEGNRYKVNGGPGTGDIFATGISVTGYGGDNPVTIIVSETILYTPVDESGQDGNAWVVTSASNSYVNIVGIYIAPDPTVPALDETTGHWNFLMPGSNKVVKAVLLDSIVVGPHITVGDLPIEGKYANGTDTVYYYDTTSHPSITLAAAANDGQGRSFGYWADLDPTDPEYSYYLRYISFSRLTCGDTFRAVYPENHTLILANEGFGTVELDGVTYDTLYTITFEHADHPGDNRTFTVSSLPYDTTFSYNDDVMSANVNEPSGKLSIINQGDQTVTLHISGAFEGQRSYSCMFWSDDLDDWLISCEASIVPVYPYGITKTNDNTYSVMEGLTVNVTATPEKGFRLAQWSDQTEPVEGDARLGGSHSYTMPATDATLTATFVQNPVLTLAQTDGGTVTLDGVTPGATTYDITIRDHDTHTDVTYTNVTFPFQTTVFLHEGLDEVGGDELDPVSVEKDGNNAVITIREPYGGGRTIDYRYWEMAVGLKSIFCDAVEGAPTTPEGATYAGYNTYLVLPGTQLSVTATPDSAHYLSAIDGHDTVSNSACGYSFQMPDDGAELVATFTTKPVLTVEANNGGTLDAIVPSPAATAIVPPTDQISLWESNYGAPITENDMPATLGFVAVDSAAAKAWTGAPASGDIILIYSFNGENIHYLTFNNGRLTGNDESPFSPGGFYDMANEGTLYITTGVTKSNVTASTEPNTYYIDYNTDVTVVATPDSAHYLADFDGTDVRNDNDTATKTYTNLTANLTATANFAAKPVLTLTSNNSEWGTVTLDGVTPASLGTGQLSVSVPGNWDDDWAYVSSTDMPTDFQGVDENVARAWQNTTGKAVYLIFAKVGDKVKCYHFYADGTYVETSFTPRKASIYDFVYDDGLALYTTGVTPGGMPAGVVSANATLDTFVVDYGATLTVTATPDSIHYLATLGGVTLNSNVAKDTTFALTATTNLAANFEAKPTLTLAHNDGGEMEIVPAGGATATHLTRDQIPTWQGSYDYVMEADLQPFGFVAVDSAAAAAWTGAPASGEVHLLYAPEGGDMLKALVFRDGQWSGAYTAGYPKGYFYDYSDIIYFTTGVGKSNVIASAEPNTYYIDYNTDVTVKATPSDTTYLVRFDQDADTNSNTAVEKTYTVSGNTTATATFTHKPLLTLNQTEGGELNIGGRSARVSELTSEMKSGWNDDNTLVTPADLPGFQAVDADLAATWTGASPSGYTYLICELTQDDLVRYVVFYDGSYSTDFLSDGRKNGVNMMTMGNHAYYTTGITFPQGILATETPNAYAVDYDSTVVVVAKPDQHYHLTSWSNNYIINATLTDTLRVNNNATLTASFAKNAPELAWTYHGIPVANGTAISAYHGFEADTIDYIDTLVNEEFTYARYKEDASLRYGSTNPAVVSYDENGNYTINGAGTTTIYMVHDGSLMAYDSAYITFTLLAPDTLTLVNNEGGNMTVEIGGGNAVWNSETWADWTDWNVKQHTVEGITIDATGYAGDYNEGGRGKLFLSAFDSGDSIIFSSANGNFTRIEMTFVDDQNKTVNGEGWGAEGNMAVWTGSAREVVIPNCTTLVGQITFFRSGSGNSADSLRAISENTYAAVPGATATVTATPDSVHYLVRFDNDDAINSNIAAEKTYTVSGNTTATANFNAKPTITLAQNEAEWGSVTLQTIEGVRALTDNTYRVDYGTEVSISAFATELHHVAAWTNEDSTAYTDSILYTDYFVTEPVELFPAYSLLTITLTGDTMVRAMFGINSYDVVATTTLDDRVSGEPLLMGTVEATYFDIEGAERSIAPDTNLMLTAQGGSTTTLVAKAEYGYVFKHWTAGNGIYLSDTLRVGEATDAKAVFVPDTFTVTLAANDSLMGSAVIAGMDASTDGTYTIAYLSEMNIMAVPASRCFDFAAWSNIAETTAVSIQTVTLTGDTSITATFVRHDFPGDTNASECDLFAWHDSTYTLTPAEAPAYLYLTPDGCDSTVTLHLTVRHSNTGVETATACDRYEWQGTVYTKSDTLDQRTLTNIEGCDSVVTLNLTVNYHHDTAYNDQADVRYEWLGEVFTENGVYVRTIETYQGCDSTITLTLAIAPYETPIPDIYHLMGAMLMINHFPEGFDSVGYIYYRWYRDGELVKEGLDADSYDEGGVLLDGCYYLEISTDANHKYWAKSNELCFNKGVGIADVETVSLAIAPNPVAKGSRVSVIVSGAADLQGAILTIYDAQGRQVMNTEMTNSNFEIQNTQFASGIYTVRVALRDGRIATKRLVVR